MNTYCIHIPRFEGASSKEPSSSAKLLDGLFAEAHKVLNKNDVFSLEIYCTNQTIYLTFSCEENIEGILKGIFYSASNFCNIKQISDYLQFVNDEDYIVASTDLRLKRNGVFPIKNYENFPFDSLTNVLNQLLSFSSEDNVLIQIVCKPFIPSGFFLKTVRPKIRRDRIVRMATTLKYWINDKPYDEYLKSAEEKCYNLANFSINIRIASFISRKLAPSQVIVKRLENNLTLVSDSFNSYNHALNGFISNQIKFGSDKLIKFYKRSLDRKPLILSTKELSTLWHIPSAINFTNIPTVPSVKLAPPKDLQTNVLDPMVSYFATTDYRDTKINFGIHREDRRRHLYIVGKSGNGKSSLMKLLAKSDIKHGAGICVLDPHGDLVDSILTFIPKERIQDVIIFDPSDLEYPLTFNPFSGISNSYRMQFVTSFIEIFKKTFSSIWNDKFEYILRYALLTVLSLKDTSFLSIVKILTNRNYRLGLVAKLTDNILKNFWFNEFDNFEEEYNDTVLQPLLNKFDVLMTNEYLRNIFLQKNNEFNFRDIIDNNKILLLKLPKGILGDEVVSFLGSVLVFKIYHAAMSRADIPEAERKDFYFYIDEFHSFMTDSVKQILSESRKYKLNLTMANQYLGQLPKDVQDTIFGNIANIIAFGAGGDDAERLASELSQDISKSDIMNLAPRHLYVKMSIKGEVQSAFSGVTLEINDTNNQDYTNECIEYSREHYSVNLENIDDFVNFDDEFNKQYDSNYNVQSCEKNYSDNNGGNLKQYLRCYGTVLLLSYLDISNESLDQLKDSSFLKVEELDLKGTCISDISLNNLEYLPELMELKLDGTNITSNGMKYLDNIKSLDLLSLNDTQIDDEAISYLTPLSILNLSLRNTLITNKSIEYFDKIKDLEELDIRGTLIDEYGVSRLKAIMPDLIVIF